MPPIINREKCIRCDRCADICQRDVFFDPRQEGVPSATYPEERAHCNARVLEFYVKGAIKLRIPRPMMER